MDNQSGSSNGNNSNEAYVRRVVIEPPKPPITTLKQYVALIDFHDGDIKAKKGQMVWIPANEATVLTAQNFVVPLNAAIRQGIYPPKDESFVGRFKTIAQKADERPVKETLQESTQALQEASKKLLGNQLRDVVQGRSEAEDEEAKAKLTADKLAAIKAGGKGR
jgi:hypothetical protein